MAKTVMQEYLVLGGEHHGEVWRGVYPALWLTLSDNDKRAGQFYTRDSGEKIVLRPDAQLFITEWKSPQGSTWLLIAEENLTEFDIAEEIARIFPPLRPLDGPSDDFA